MRNLSNCADLREGNATVGLFQASGINHLQLAFNRAQSSRRAHQQIVGSVPGAADLLYSSQRRKLGKTGQERRADRNADQAQAEGYDTLPSPAQRPPGKA